MYFNIILLGGKQALIYVSIFTLLRGQFSMSATQDQLFEGRRDENDVTYQSGHHQFPSALYLFPLLPIPPHR